MNVIRFLQRKTECSVLHDYKTVQQALSKLADAAAAKAKKHGVEGRTLVISHCNCPDRAVYVRNLLFKKLPFTRVEIVRTGGISTVYAGDGGVVVAF